MPNAWTQKRGTRHRGLYRDPDGRTRSAGTFQYEFQAQEAADLAAQGQSVAPEITPEELVADYATRWLRTRVAIRPQTRRSYAGSVANHITPALGELPMAELTKGRVREWVAAMETDPGTGVAARNMALKVLRMMCKQAVEEDEILTKDPTAGIKRQRAELKAPKAFLGDDQITDLLEATTAVDWVNTSRGGRRVTLPPDGMFTLAVLLGVDAGLRWEEIAALDLASVVEKGNRMRLHVYRTTDRKGRIVNRTKNGDARDVPVVTERLQRALRQQARIVKLARGSLLIHRPDGSPVRYEHWQRVLLAGAYQAAGISATGWHDLRHTFGSRLAEDGVPTKIIATLMGHNEEDVTQIYMHDSTMDVLERAATRALSG